MCLKRFFDKENQQIEEKQMIRTIKLNYNANMLESVSQIFIEVLLQGPTNNMFLTTICSPRFP